MPRAHPPRDAELQPPAGWQWGAGKRVGVDLGGCQPQNQWRDTRRLCSSSPVPCASPTLPCTSPPFPCTSPTLPCTSPLLPCASPPLSAPSKTPERDHILPLLPAPAWMCPQLHPPKPCSTSKTPQQPGEGSHPSSTPSPCPQLQPPQGAVTQGAISLSFPHEIKEQKDKHGVFPALVPAEMSLPTRPPQGKPTQPPHAHC